MEKFDEKIISMAREELIEIPHGYENRIEELVVRLSNENKRKRRRGNFSNHTKMVAGVAVFMMVSVGTWIVTAGTSDEQKVGIKKTELDEIYVINTKRLEIESDEYGIIEYNWNSYDELQERLGIKLLRNEKECETEFMNISDQTDNEDYHNIQIENFAMTEQKFVDMKISIRCSEEQSIEGLFTEFIGDFQKRGSYVSEQGYKVILIGYKTLSLQDTNDDVIDGTISGLFVADGILYEISGELSVNQMRKFIDSLFFL